MSSRLSVASIFLFHLLTQHIAQALDHAPAGVQSQEYNRICPLPKCESCPSIDELRAPAIGLALEIAHGKENSIHHSQDEADEANAALRW